MDGLSNLTADEVYELTTQELARRGTVNQSDQEELEAIREQRTKFTRLDLVRDAMTRNIGDMTDDEKRGFTESWARTATMGSKSMEKAGETTQLTSDQYFQQHKDIDSRVKYVQNLLEPGRHKDILSEYQKMAQMSEEERIEYTKNKGKELGFLPSREVIMDVFERMVSPTGIKGMKADLTGMAKQLLEAETWSRRTREIESDIANRVMAEEFAKDYATLQQAWSSMLSEEAVEFATTTAKTGRFDFGVFYHLEEHEQELTAHYTRLLRDYSDRGRWSQFFHTFWGSVGARGDEILRFSGRGMLGLPSVWMPEQVGQALMNWDDMGRLARMEKMAMETKYADYADDVFGMGQEGAMVFAESLPYALLAIKAAPLAVLRGSMAVASFAQGANDMLQDAGVDADKADLYSPFIGGAMYFTERINNLFSLGKPSKKIISQEISKGLLRKFVDLNARGIKTISLETVEEVGQTLQESVPKQLLTDGTIDGKELIGVTTETIEQMLKAGPFFAATGEITPVAAPRFKTAIEKYGFGMADLQATDLMQRTDEFEGKAEGLPEFTVQDVLERIDPRANVEDIENELEILGLEQTRGLARSLHSMKRKQTIEAVKAYQESQERAKEIRADEEKFEDFRGKLTDAGFTVEEVDAVSGAIDEMVQGAIDGTNIEVLRAAPKKAQIARHEVFHKFLEDYGVEVGLISQEQLDMLKGATDRIMTMLQGAGLDIEGIYDFDDEAMQAIRIKLFEGGLTTDEEVDLQQRLEVMRIKRKNEILADAGAVLNEQELTLYDRMLDLVEKIRNFFGGRGFQSVRSILKDVEARGFEQAPRLTAREKLIEELTVEQADMPTTPVDMTQDIDAMLDEMEAEIVEEKRVRDVEREDVASLQEQRQTLEAIIESRRLADRNRDTMTEEEVAVLERADQADADLVAMTNEEIQEEMDRMDRFEDQQIDKEMRVATQQAEKELTTTNQVRVAKAKIRMRKEIEQFEGWEDERFFEVNPFEIEDFLLALDGEKLSEIRTTFEALRKQLVKWNDLTEETKERRAGRMVGMRSETTEMMSEAEGLQYTPEAQEIDAVEEAPTKSPELQKLELMKKPLQEIQDIAMELGIDIKTPTGKPRKFSTLVNKIVEKGGVSVEAPVESDIDKMRQELAGQSLEIVQEVAKTLDIEITTPKGRPRKQGVLVNAIAKARQAGATIDILETVAESIETDEIDHLPDRRLDMTDAKDIEMAKNHLVAEATKAINKIVGEQTPKMQEYILQGLEELAELNNDQIANVKRYTTFYDDFGAPLPTQVSVNIDRGQREVDEEHRKQVEAEENVTFQVPGDGRYKVVNNLGALLRFRAKVAYKFKKDSRAGKPKGKGLGALDEVDIAKAAKGETLLDWGSQGLDYTDPKTRKKKRFARRKPLSKKLVEKLESEETVTLYRAMALIDGKLYPPMSAKMTDPDTGKLSLRNDEPIGEWQQSQERPDIVPTEGANKGKFPLKKPGGGTTWALYAPYFHASPIPLNDQFTAAWKNDGIDRPQIVTVEVEVPKSEMDSGYQAEGSTKTVGANKWNSGVVASKIPGGREVVLSRYLKIKRIVPDAEVAQEISTLVTPNRLQIPENTVTPQLRAELEKVGVRIAPPGTRGEAIRYARRNVPTMVEVDGVQRRNENSEGNPIALDEASVRNFWRWFGGSVVLDDEGRPKVVYHGTVREFEEFTHRFAYKGGDMGAGFYFTDSYDDVATNYGTPEGADITQRIEMLKEGLIDAITYEPDLYDLTEEQVEDPDFVDQFASEKIREDLEVGEGRIVEVYLRITNPFHITDTTSSYGDTLEMEFDPEDEGAEPTGSLVDFIETLREVASEWEISEMETNDMVNSILDQAGYEEIAMASVAKILQETYVVDYDTGDPAAGDFLREVTTRAGYDGIIDSTVFSKWGARRMFGTPMAGLRYDTNHYIISDSTAVKSTDNLGTFSPEDKRYRHARRKPTVEYAAEAYAMAKMKGRDINKYVEGLAARTGLTVEEIVKLGEQLVEDATDKLDATADDLEKRIAVRTASADRIIAARLRKAHKLGIALGEVGMKAQVEVDRRAEEDMRKYADGIPANQLRKQYGIDVNRLIRDGQDVVATLVGVAQQTAEAGGVTKEATLNHIKRTLSKALKKAARGLVSGTIKKGVEKVDTVTQAEKIDNVKTLDGVIAEANRVVKRIRDNIIEETEQVLQSEITKILKPFGKKIAEKEREGKHKLSKQSRLVLKRAYEFWRMSGNKYEEAIRELQLELNGMTYTSDDPTTARKKAELDAKLQAYRLIDQAKTASDLGTLQDTIANLNYAMSEGFAKAEAKRKEIAERSKADRDVLVSDLIGQRKDKKPVDPDTRTFLDTYMNPIHAMEALSSSKEGDAITRELQRESDIGWNMARTEVLRLRERAEKELKKLGFGSIADFTRAMRIENKKFLEFSDEGRTNLSKAHLLKLIFQLERADMDKHDDNKNVQRRMAQLDKMKAQFTPKELQAARLLRDLGEEVYLSIFDQVEETTGLPPIYVENYFPLTWNRQAPGGAGVVRLVSDIPGFLIPTVVHKFDLDETNGDFFDLLFNHIDELVMFKHMDAMKSRIKGGILSSQVLEQIRKTHGQAARDLFDHQLTDLIAGHALLSESKVSKSLTDEVWGVARAGAAYSSLFGRIPSMFRQIADIGAVTLALDLKTAARVFAEMGTPEGIKRALAFAKHPLMKERMKGRIDEGSVNILDKISKLPSKKLRGALAGAMRVPGFGDVVGFSLVGGQLLDIMLTTDPKYKSMPPAEAKEMATAEVVGMLERLYQSTEAKDLSPEIRDAGELKRGVTQFLTADLAKLSVEIMRYRKWKAGAPGAGQRLAKTLFINHVLLPMPQLMISFLFQNLLRGEPFDEDEYAEIAMQMLAGPFRGAAFIGTLIFAASNTMHKFNTPAQNLAGNVLDALFAIKDTDWGDSDDVMKLLEKWLKMIGTYRDVKDVRKFMEENL